jgi:hypothetical protein
VDLLVAKEAEEHKALGPVDQSEQIVGQCDMGDGECGKLQNLWK